MRNNLYEVRYKSELIHDMALWSQSPTKALAQEQLNSFVASVRKGPCDERAKAGMLKSVCICIP